MTAEIAIMNRLGIALAADSAITHGSGPGKIYTSAEKLFLLSEEAPVGIMIWGQADLQGTPWETIIKTCRRQLGHETLLSLTHYKEYLVQFLDTFKPLLSEPAQEQCLVFLALSACYDLLGKLEETLQNELCERELEEEDVKAAFSALVEGELTYLEKQDLLEGLPEEFPQDIRSHYDDLLNSVVEKMLGSFPVSESTHEKILKLIAQRISRERSLDVSSGVVIAGFGENDYFPCLVDIVVKGVLLDRVLYWTNRQEAIDHETTAYIIPFAQQEMVHTFMEGIDPLLRTMIERTTDSVLRNVAKTILEEVKAKDAELGQDLEERVSGTIDQMVNGLLDMWNASRNENQSAPIMANVAALPKNDLATMAEALVNLTAFKRRVSPELETVGGPVDVAVITKGDGFVWVQRKHYFKAELNPRFMARYYRRGE